MIDDLIANTQTARQQNAFIKEMTPWAPDDVVPVKANQSDFEIPVNLVVRVAAVLAVVLMLCGSYIILMGADPLTVADALGL